MCNVDKVHWHLHKSFYWRLVTSFSAPPGHPDSICMDEAMHVVMKISIQIIKPNHQDHGYITTKCKVKTARLQLCFSFT